MKVLLPWLRQFVPVSGTAQELAHALSLAGIAVDRIDGDLLELDLTSNRPDCLSHYGVARELAAITGQKLLPLASEPLAAETSPRIAIEAPEACGRYCAVILDNVRVAGSPAEVVRRLEALGQRAINNIADLTNDTLWEMGQPTHAFDLDKLRGGAIRVRFARPGETLVTLDEVERKLDPADLLIADAERPVALAGVMGGLETAISSATRRVLLESAWFDPLTVRRTARRHGLHTDASHRFERGADPEAAPLAAARIARRAAAYGATIASGLLGADGTLPARAPIPLRSAAVDRILGKGISPEETARILQALGCEHCFGAWLAPSWRPDLTREIDLIEELARIHGYEKFPTRLPEFRGAAAPLPHAALIERLRQQLRGRGFAEAVTLSFASEDECRQFAAHAVPVRVLNPLSEEAAILRTTSLPAMLHLLRNNLHHGVATPRLFEVGKRYQLEAGQPTETALLSLGACDPQLEFAAFKGEVEALTAAFQLPATASRPGAPDYFHPGRSAWIGDYAVYGQIHPELAAAWKLPPEVWLAELQLARLLALGPRRLQYHPPSRYPASQRDFSFQFPDAVTWDRIAAALASPPIAFVAQVQPAEPPFRGPHIPEAHYSLLVRARFQSDERTLRDDEVQASADELAARLRSLGGVQR